MLWECINNNDNIFNPNELSLNYLFKFFYLDIIFNNCNNDIYSNYINNIIKNEKPNLPLEFPLKRNLITLPHYRNDLFLLLKDKVFYFLL